MSIDQLARRIYAAYETKDRAAVEALVAPDFHFSSPLDDRIDRAAYFERCWPGSATMKSMIIEDLSVQDQTAIVRYKAETLQGKVFRNTEWLRFEGGQLVEVDVYFGRTLKEAEPLVRLDEPINRPAPDIATQLNAWAFD